MSNDKIRKRKYRKLSIIIIICSLVIIACVCSSNLPNSTNDSSINPNSDTFNAPQVNTDIIVEKGKLYEISDSYPWSQDVFVKKLNGSTDPRENDLESLCKDWLFYRYKTLEADGKGDSDKASEYRIAFQEINAWLDEYDETDISTMFTILEKDGYSWP